MGRAVYWLAYTVAAIIALGCLVAWGGIVLGMVLVGLVCVLGTAMVLAIMAAGCWAVISIMKAWDDLVYWHQAACVARAGRKAYAAWVKANPDPCQRIHMNGPGNPYMDAVNADRASKGLPPLRPLRQPKGRQ
jgi:hypothetical protein